MFSLGLVIEGSCLMVCFQILWMKAKRLYPSNIE